MPRRIGDIPFNQLPACPQIAREIDFRVAGDNHAVILPALGYSESVDLWIDKYRHPILEALTRWTGTVEELRNLLEERNQTDALHALYFTIERVLKGETDVNCGHMFDITQPDLHWETLLDSEYVINQFTIERFDIFARGSLYALDVLGRAAWSIFPFAAAADMSVLTTMSNLLNYINSTIFIITLVLNIASIFLDGVPFCGLPMIITFVLWVKIYLLKGRPGDLRSRIQCIIEIHHRLSRSEPNSRNSRRLERQERMASDEAQIVDRDIRDGLIMSVCTKALALFAAFIFILFTPPDILGPPNWWTYFCVLIFFMELVHNIFFLTSYYRDPTYHAILDRDRFRLRATR